MRTPAIFTAFCLCVLVAGCSKDATPTDTPTTPKAGEAAAMKGDDCANCPDAAMAPATTHDPVVLTKGITLEKFTPISEILGAPADFEGKRVLVKGEAVAVCEMRGCWVTLKSEADNSKALRVKVEDGEIVFPMTIKGHEVIAEGVVEKMVTSEEDYREILRKRAESKGEEFDPKSVTGPRITWQLKGLGARWEN